MPTEIVQLLAFDGPNLYGPRPGVLLRVRSDKDRAARVKNALKDGAQSAGMVLAYLDVWSESAGDGYLIGASFATPTPAIGVELARYVVAGLNARETGDETWDADTPLWDLQKRRRAEALPLPALQLIAEAAARGVPSFVRRDGLVQLGYGTRGWAFDPGRPAVTGSALAPDEIGIGSPVPARLNPASAPAPIAAPWEQLGPIPLVAVAGGATGDIAARMVAAAIGEQGQLVRLAIAADFDATRELLADPSAAIAVVGLQTADIARRGLAFEHCAFSAVASLPAELPPEIADRAELARVLGVPMLVTDSAGRVALNADVSEIAALAEYAPCPIIYTSTAEENPLVGFHRAEGGQALFVRDSLVIAANGPAELAVVAAALPPEQLPGALAGLALLWAMGLILQLKIEN